MSVGKHVYLLLTKLVSAFLLMIILGLFCTLLWGWAFEGKSLDSTKALVLIAGGLAIWPFYFATKWWVGVLGDAGVWKD